MSVERQEKWVSPVFCWRAVRSHPLIKMNPQRVISRIYSWESLISAANPRSIPCQQGKGGQTKKKKNKKKRKQPPSCRHFEKPGWSGSIHAWHATFTQGGERGKGMLPKRWPIILILWCYSGQVLWKRLIVSEKSDLAQPQKKVGVWSKKKKREENKGKKGLLHAGTLKNQVGLARYTHDMRHSPKEKKRGKGMLPKNGQSYWSCGVIPGKSFESVL